MAAIQTEADTKHLHTLELYDLPKRRHSQVMFQKTRSRKCRDLSFATTFQTQDSCQTSTNMVTWSVCLKLGNLCKFQQLGTLYKFQILLIFFFLNSCLCGIFKWGCGVCVCVCVCVCRSQVCACAMHFTHEKEVHLMQISFLYGFSMCLFVRLF